MKSKNFKTPEELHAAVIVNLATVAIIVNQTSELILSRAWLLLRCSHRHSRNQNSFDQATPMTIS